MQLDFHANRPETDRVRNIDVTHEIRLMLVRDDPDPIFGPFRHSDQSKTPILIGCRLQDAIFPVWIAGHRLAFDRDVRKQFARLRVFHNPFDRAGRLGAEVNVAPNTESFPANW